MGESTGWECKGREWKRVEGSSARLGGSTRHAEARSSAEQLRVEEEPSPGITGLSMRFQHPHGDTNRV